MKVEQVFACYNYNEEKKYQIDLLESKGYALVWCNQVKSDVERMRRPLINTWQDIKRVLRERDLCRPIMGGTFTTSSKD